MKNFLFLLTALFALTATQVRADEGLYAGVFAGPNWLNTSTKRVKTEFKVGYLVGGSIGYRWCGGLRLEGELAYRHNQLDKARLKHHEELNIPSNEARLKGNFRTWSYMANVLYDLPFECSPVKVYFGGGIGGANQKLCAHRKHCSNHSKGNGSNDSSQQQSKKHRSGNKDQNSFAAQAIVGLGYNICENLDFNVEYRFFYTHKSSSKHCHSDNSHDLASNKNSLSSNRNNNSLVFGVQTGF